MSGASYEVQGYSGGRWQVLAVFDDKQLAITDADRLRSVGRFSALRVQSEVYDEARRHYIARIVHRYSRLDPQNFEAVRGDWPERPRQKARPDPVRVLSQLGRGGRGRRYANLEPLPSPAAWSTTDARLFSSAITRLASILLIGVGLLLWINWLKHLH